MSLTLIATTTVGAGGASSIDFTSIPATYTDLLVVCSLRSIKADAVGAGLVKINGVTTNLSNRSLIGDGGGAYSANYTTTRLINSVNGATSTANTFSTHNVYFPNYAGSTNKSFSADGASENNGGYMELGIMANLWSNTAAITSLSIYSDANLAQYSSASLYGITKGSGGATVSP